MLWKRLLIVISFSLIMLCFTISEAMASFTITPTTIIIENEESFQQSFTIPDNSVDSQVKVNWYCDLSKKEYGGYFKIIDSKGTTIENKNGWSSYSGYFWANRNETYTIIVDGGYSYSGDTDYFGCITGIVSYNIKSSYDPYQDIIKTVPISINIEREYRFKQYLVIPGGSVDSILRVDWQCDFRYTESGAFFRIADIYGNNIVNQTGTGSGYFYGKPGDVYLFESYGGGDDDYTGYMDGKISFNPRFKCDLVDEFGGVNNTFYSVDININRENGFEEKFSIPNCSFDPIVKVLWQFDLSEAISDAYFRITDSKGKIIVYNDIRDLCSSGIFWAKRGEIYTVKAYGGMYDHGDYDYEYGNVSGKVAYNIRCNSHFYRVENNDSHSCRKDHRYIYFPSNIATGIYYCKNYSENINTSTSLITKPYSVWVKYVYHLDDPDEDGNDSSPYLSISRVDTGGNVIPGTESNKYISQGQTLTEYIELRPYEGLLFDYYMGDWYYRGGVERNHRSYTGYLEIAYQFDNKSPETPKPPRILDGIEVEGKYYVKPSIKVSVK